MRYEIAFDKMQAMGHFRIFTLADLQDFNKVYPLVNILTETEASIIWNDTSVNLNRLTDREKRQWWYFTNPLTWQQDNKHKRNRSLKTWKSLLPKYGNPPVLLPLIIQTWESLFKKELQAQKPLPFYQLDLKDEASENATCLPLECSGGKLHHEELNFLSKHSPSHKLKKDKKSPAKGTKKEGMQCCLTCGRNISRQKKGSKFCIEKFYGKSRAKKCSNKHSNQRRYIKTQIKNAMNRNKSLIICYGDNKGTHYSDVLHSTELSIPDLWLERIQKITYVK